MMVESCTQAVCDLALRFGEDSGKSKEDIMVCFFLFWNIFWSLC